MAHLPRISTVGFKTCVGEIAVRVLLNINGNQFPGADGLGSERIPRHHRRYEPTR